MSKIVLFLTFYFYMLPFGFRLLEGIKLLGAGEATGGV